MVVQNNISTLIAEKSLRYNNSELIKSMENLSSGFQINRAGDDAAGLSISEKMRSQIRGLNRAINNAQDGISFIQTAEGALTEVHDMVQRIRELAIQAANGVNQSEDRAALNSEVSQLKSEITRIAEKTKFNEKLMIDSTKDKISFQVGPYGNDTISISMQDMTASSIKLGSSITVSTADKAQTAISAADSAIKSISAFRSLLGATQNRLEHTIANLAATYENVSASESRIRDTDMASEMMRYTRTNILSQAAQTMLAQSNTRPQMVLHLLQQV